MEVPHRGAAGSSINFNKHRQGHATEVLCQNLTMVRGHDALDQSPGAHLGFGVIGLPIRNTHRGRDAVSRMQDDRVGWGEVL